MCAGLPAQEAAGSAQPFPQMMKVDGGTFSMKDYDGSMRSVTVSDFEISATAEYFSCTWWEAARRCNSMSREAGYTPCYSLDGSTDESTWGTPPYFNEGDGYSGDWEKWSRIQCDFNADGYRLPTEAEWEFAARGGNKSHGYRYSGSDDLAEVGWYYGNVDIDTSYFDRGGIYPDAHGKYHQDYAQKKPNELGLYDMSGNLWEWCWDWYGQSNPLEHTDPAGYSDGKAGKGSKVIRGGAWQCPPEACAVDAREALQAGMEGSYTALRPCRSLTTGRSGKTVVQADAKTLSLLKPDMANFLGSQGFLLEEKFGGATAALQGFQMATTELSREQYALATGGELLLAEGNLPATGISWYEAVALCNKLSILYGLKPCYSIKGKTDPAVWSRDASAWEKLKCDFYADGYRLPTEAEWGFAAQSGSKNVRKAYGTESSPDEVCWYAGNSGGQCHSVTSKKGNEEGLHCMSGNAQEWCWDWYGDYPAEKQLNPEGALTGSTRVLRGGGWASPAAECTIYRRGNAEPGFADDTSGLRLCRTVGREQPKKSLFARIVSFFKKLLEGLFS